MRPAHQRRACGSLPCAPQVVVQQGVLEGSSPLAACRPCAHRRLGRGRRGAYGAGDRHPRHGRGGGVHGDLAGTGRRTALDPRGVQ